MPKVKLAQLERAYLLKMRDWRNDDELRSRTREYSLLNMVNQEDWFEKVSRDRNNEMFAIHYKTGFIGICGLCYIDWVSRKAEVSIYIGDKHYQHKGIQALQLLKNKAFDEYNLRRLWAEVYAFNEYNIQLFEEGGFVYEGRLRHHVFKLGKYHDSLMYGLLRE